MSVIVKGDSPFDAFIVSGIKDCHTEHIKFYNISFNCKTIEDADGRVFTRREERKTGKWIPVDSYSAFGGDEVMWEAHGNPIAFYYCSECKEHAYAGEDGESLLTTYCPNCGADMRGDSNDRQM